MNKDQFVMFDKILIYLSANSHKSITCKDVLDNAFPETKNATYYFKLLTNNVFRSNSNLIFDSSIEDTEKNELIYNALYYLKGDGLVNYTMLKQREYSSVEITSKGLIKIKTLGFQKEFSRGKWNHRFERFEKIITPVIAILAFALSVYNYYQAK